MDLPAFPSEEDRDRRQGDRQVEPQRPSIEVLEVVVHADRQGGVGPGPDLPEPGQPRPHGQPSGVHVVLERHLFEFMRARPDQAHVPPEHVPQLGKLVQAEPAEQPAQGRDTRIVGDLDHAFGEIRGHQRVEGLV